MLSAQEDGTGFTLTNSGRAFFVVVGCTEDFFPLVCVTTCWTMLCCYFLLQPPSVSESDSLKHRGLLAAEQESHATSALLEDSVVLQL